jgi:hypothetical protein
MRTYKAKNEISKKLVNYILEDMAQTKEDAYRLKQSLDTFKVSRADPNVLNLTFIKARFPKTFIHPKIAVITSIYYGLTQICLSLDISRIRKEVN